MNAYNIKSPRGVIDEAILQQWEDQFGAFPPAYRTFLQQTGGGSVLFEQELDRDGRKYEVMEYYSLHDISEKSFIFEDRFDTGIFLPFATAPNGDIFVIDRKDGSVWFWDHECQDPPRHLFNSFDEFWANIHEPTKDPLFDLDFTTWRDLPKEWRNSEGFTICECAAMEGKLAVVRECLKKNYPPGKELMHIAALNGRLDIVDELIKWGFDINILDDGGTTPLDRAAWKPKYVEALRSLGAKRSVEL